MKRIATALLVTLTTISASLAQEAIYPELSGEELIRALDDDYSPANWYGYDQARDTLFARIDGRNGTLTGVYTGFAIEMDPTADPSADASEKGIDIEHSYPPSMGANDAPASSDMHHLFPARADVKAARSNRAYANVDDGHADAWYHLDQSRTDVPPGDLGVWSRVDEDQPVIHFQGRFEPRADHKGDAARAVFYFRTMYPERADDPFFEYQKTFLLDWHRQDPPDEAEIARSRLIAEHQGTPNPFVLDTSLVRRAYYADEGREPVVHAVAYRFGGNDACPTTDDGPATHAGPVAFSDFFREGVGCTRAQGAFESGGWPSGAERTPDLYVGFTATPEPYGSIALDERTLSFTLRRSPTGPTRAALLHRMAGDEAFRTIETFELPDTAEHAFDVLMPVMGSSDPMYFRWYGWAAASPSGTLRIDDVVLEYTTGTATARERAELPRSIRLRPAYPNPFNPATTITFELDGPGEVTLEAVDALGRRVALLVDGTLPAGAHETAWRADRLPSGVYLIRLRAAGQVTTRTVTLLK